MKIFLQTGVYNYRSDESIFYLKIVEHQTLGNFLKLYNLVAL